MTAPDPRDVDRLIAGDPKIVKLLADYVQSTKTPKPPPAPTPPPAPSPKRTTSKPTAKTKKTERAPMRSVKKNPATKPTKPTRRGVEIRAIDDPVPSNLLTLQEHMARSLPTPPPPMLKTDAHQTNDQTPCAICGGQIEVSEVYDRHGPWRRHHECVRVVSRPANRVAPAALALGLGVVDETVAALVAYRIPLFGEGHVEPTFIEKEKRPRPWVHVDKKMLLTAIAEAIVERDEREIPRPCLDGRCAWCGVEESLDWFGYGHHWRDGSDAPLCVACATVYVRRGEPSPDYFNDQRPALCEAMTGVPAMMGESAPPGLLAYAEADAEGDGAAWSHLPASAVEAYRMTQWGRFSGRYAPTERRAEAIAHVRAIEADRAAQRAELDAEQTEQADVFGFLKES